MKLEERLKLNITGIYLIKNNITGHCYVGQAKNISKRIWSHLNSSISPEASDYDYPLHKAFRRYGVDNFDLQVLEECSVKDLNEKEIYWIARYDSKRNGYNQTEGGNYTVAKKLPKAVLKQLKADLIANKLTNSELSKKYSVSESIISRINIGLAWKEDSYSYPLRKVTAIITNHYNGSCVYQLDKKTNELINIFPSINSAAKALGSEEYNAHIVRCCNGKRKSAYGYKWQQVPISEENWLKLFK